MTDPIAEAAKQQADAAPSSTEPGIVEQLVDEFHKLEEKVEHLIHSEPVGDGVTDDTAALQAKQSAEVAQPGESVGVAGDSQPSASSPQSASAASMNLMQNSEPEEPISSKPIESSMSDGSSEAATIPSNGLPLTAKNTIPQWSNSSAESVASVGTNAPNAATPAASTDAPESTGEDPNAAASPAASPAGVDLVSSAQCVSAAAMLAASDSVVRERALVAISRLRAHFWTFDHWAVQHLHAELDFLEGLFKYS